MWCQSVKMSPDFNKVPKKKKFLRDFMKKVVHFDTLTPFLTQSIFLIKSLFYRNSL